MADLKIQEHDNKTVFTAKIVPGSSKTSIEGLLDGMIKIKVAAAPEKGKANKELIAFLAKKLGLRKKDISVISGQTNPVKQIEVMNVTKSDIKSLIS